MFLIRYLVNRETDLPLATEPCNAGSVEDAAEHARARIRATHVSGSDAARPTGFLIFDEGETRPLHREYLETA